MENKKDKENKSNSKFRPLKIKEIDYSFLVTILLSSLSVCLNFFGGYLIFAFLVGSLVILKSSIDEPGCLSYFIQIGIGAAIVLGLKYNAYEIVILLVIGTLIYMMLDPKCSFKINEDGIIKFGFNTISLQDVRFIYTIKNNRTVFYSENQELTKHKFLFKHHNEQLEQYFQAFKNVFVFTSEEKYITTCALAMIVYENPDTKQSTINYLKQELSKTDSEISELLYAFRNKHTEFKEQQRKFSKIFDNKIKEESQKNFLGVLFQCSTYKGRCSDQVKDKIHYFSEMFCIPEETFLAVANIYDYNSDDKGEHKGFNTGKEIVADDIKSKGFNEIESNHEIDIIKGFTNNIKNKEFPKEKSEKEDTPNIESQTSFNDKTKELINYYFQFWKDEHVLGPNGEFHVGKVKLNDNISCTVVVFLVCLLLGGITKNAYIRFGTIIYAIIIIIYMIILSFKRSYDLSISPEHIILKKSSKSKKNTLIKLCDITKISPIQSSEKHGYSYTISIGDDIITLSSYYKKNSSENQCHAFLDEIVNGNRTYIETNMYQNIAVNLFASIVNSDNDSNSIKYAINYLYQKYWSNDSIINVYKLFYSSLKNTQRINDNDYLKYRNITNYEERYILLDHLFECAYISDGVDEKEMEILQKAADSLHIKEWDIKSLKYKYDYRKAEQEKDEEKKKERKKNAETSFKNVITEAHRILGLKTDATIEEIKTVYHKLAMRVHPDKLPADATPQQIEEANENFRVINEAYKFLLKKEEGKIYVNK